MEPELSVMRESIDVLRQAGVKVHVHCSTYSTCVCACCVCFFRVECSDEHVLPTCTHYLHVQYMYSTCTYTAWSVTFTSVEERVL